MKVEHLNPGGLFQEIKLPMWNWEIFNMDFVISLPWSCHQFDFIWVIMDRITNYAQFLSVRINYSVEDYARLFIKEIVKLNGAPVSIIFDQGTQFNLTFGIPFKEFWVLR